MSVAPSVSALAAEALRINARYVEEVVIGWDLCPWAAHAWRAGEVQRWVFEEARPEPQTLAAFVQDLAPDMRCAVALAIFPRAELSVGAWERFAEAVRRLGGPFLVAAFHPHYRASDEPIANAAQLVSLIRRTPDPTLQLVRAARIESLAAGRRDVSAEIAAANYATVTTRDPARLAALLDDLRRDRDRAYASLSPPRPG